MVALRSKIEGQIRCVAGGWGGESSVDLNDKLALPTTMSNG